MNDFNQRIILQQRGPKKWQNVATLPARVTPIAGDGPATQKVTIRAYPTISADMRVIWAEAVADRILRIEAIVEEQHGERMALACSEGG